MKRWTLSTGCRHRHFKHTTTLPPAPPLLLTVLSRPEQAGALTPADWDLLLRQAGSANLMAALHALLQARGLLTAIPAAAREQLDWAGVLGERHRQAVRWEVRRIRLALRDLGIPIILLKGAAYTLAGLPPAQGRLFSDIDILVAESDLDQVEAALMLAGWASTHHDAYDQRYYREWMHELPPMQHMRRESLIDVHHAILPRTAALQPDPRLLRAAAVALPDDAGLLTFAPADMVLHSATHLFHDGELNNGLRDLADIHGLLLHFGAQPGFWDELAQRAVQLHLQRPLFYALRYCQRLLATPVPASASAACDSGRPGAALLALMDALFARALLPDHASCQDAFTPAARFLLYIRANWLRMPPLLLARHLFHKAFLSPREAAPA
ncbi:nucleotidyltransferase family protein [Massilia sp. BJB1822]|uniref:nucleotidyltransferase domain-containing protein n=1 Tax=Massilia sp. BJB1822 TaxID=2744470 RepID=UPI001594A6C6|nr:nucleotidyltransferase family protein [Massilia sp. BJB1822]NVD96931.1 nucleotidyltransferase family protein [Massilia sp. BJB1822]